MNKQMLNRQMSYILIQVEFVVCRFSRHFKTGPNASPECAVHYTVDSSVRGSDLPTFQEASTIKANELWNAVSIAGICYCWPSADENSGDIQTSLLLRFFIDQFYYFVTNNLVYLSEGC